jgi:hypothetical protein
MLAIIKRHSWWALAAVTLLVGVQPLNYAYTRLFLVLAIAVLWLWGAWLIRKQRRWAWGLVGLGLVPLLALVMPGRPMDSARLSLRYQDALKTYLGTPYIWGGENAVGIDCSGLVRRAMVQALLREGVQAGNPTALRAGADLWWHDCSAKALGQGYRAYTVALGTESTLNALPTEAAQPGDLAVTSQGTHVLAALGQGRWIAADPGAGEVILMATPNRSPWFDMRISLHRWRWLD